MEVGRRERYVGMFWGLVVGDCLGSPLQFGPKDGHALVTEMEPCACFQTPPGYWTDDASMAFCVAESFVRRGGYDLADIANNFIRWMDQGFWSSLPYAFDVGEATAMAIRQIRRSGSLRNGSDSSQGNGSIMRLAPAYIIAESCGDPGILHAISDLTHDSCIVRGTVDLMASVLQDHLHGRRSSIRSIYRSREDVDHSGWAVSTLQAALWACENSTTFADALIAAVNLGGDADSIGAVCGQIAGAYYGFGAIPERWLAAIKERERIHALIEATLDTAWGASRPQGAAAGA